MNRTVARQKRVDVAIADMLAWLNRSGEIRETVFRDGCGVDRNLFEDAIGQLEANKKVRRGPDYTIWNRGDAVQYRSWVIVFEAVTVAPVTMTSLDIAAWQQGVA